MLLNKLLIINRIAIFFCFIILSSSSLYSACSAEPSFSSDDSLSYDSRSRTKIDSESYLTISRHVSKNEDDSINKPIKTTNFPWYVLLSGLAGALLGLSNTLYERWRPAKFYSKIIGLNFKPISKPTFEVDFKGTQQIISGIGFRFKVNILCNKDISIRKISVRIKVYKKYMDGIIYYIHNEYPTLQPKDFIQFNPSFAKNVTYTFYINMIVPYDYKEFSANHPEIYTRIKESNKSQFKESNKSQWNPDRPAFEELIPSFLELSLEPFKGKRKVVVFDMKDFDFYSIIPEA